MAPRKTKEKKIKAQTTTRVLGTVSVRKSARNQKSNQNSNNRIVDQILPIVFTSASGAFKEDGLKDTPFERAYVIKINGRTQRSEHTPRMDFS